MMHPRLRLALAATALAMTLGCTMPMGSLTAPGGSTATKPANDDGGEKPDTNTAVNSLRIDGKEVKVGGNGKVTQATFGGMIANLRFGGIPNGKPENAQPGEYTGLVQIGGTIKGDLTLESIVDLNISVDEVGEGFLTGVKTWKSVIPKDTFNTDGGPKVEVAGTDGMFTLVKITGAKLSSDKGQGAGNKADGDITVDVSFTAITKD